MRTHYRIRYFNFRLLFFTLAIAFIGILAVSSADESLQSKQIGGAVAGFVIMLVLAFIDYKFILKFFWIIYGINFALLLMVLFLGQKGNGAQRWIELFGIRFQPSELCKLAIIVCLAAFIAKFREDFNTFRIIALCVVMFVIPAAMVYLQPDLSTTIVLCLIFISIMFVSDVNWKVILGSIGLALPVILILAYLIMQPEQKIVSDYQKSRITSFFNKEETANAEGYQQTYSVMAIGSGQLSGKGYRNNETYSVKNADFLAEQQTDFIFSVIGEEFGFVGTCTVIVLLFLIAIECFIIAHRADSIAGRIIGAGIGSWIGFQTFINIGVVTYLLPNTGLPLPFVSHGLTSLICAFAGIGLVLNVGLQCEEK